MLDNYFKGELNLIVEENNYSIPTSSIDYLSKMLSSFTTKQVKSIYLSDFIIKFKETGEISNLKELSDSSLMISGYFFEHALSMALSYSDIIEMGISSYEYLYDLSSISVYKELSVNYLENVTVLNELSYKVNYNQNMGQLRIYTLWEQTDGEFFKKKLVQLGILPIRVQG